jgi:predicted regulator of Ras-like GTPase activity (Roadblock/LC7/MglB family)
MKSGRVVFTWTELCGWLSGTEVPPSANGESALELPLKVVAPLFMALRRADKPRKSISVAESVPDLFASIPRPAAPAPEPEPVPEPVVAPEPAQAIALAPEAAPEIVPPEPAAVPQSMAEILGQPSKTDWSPAEITKGIMAMPGIAGALLASRDGLLVAGQMPAPLKAELMAAFLPQMFTHISGSTEEVQLGKLRAMKLTTGESACAVFQAGVLCLAVLGQPGHAIPEPALERIADELAQPKN